MSKIPRPKPLELQDVERVRELGPRISHWLHHEAWAPYPRLARVMLASWAVAAAAVLAFGWGPLALLLFIQLDCLGILAGDAVRLWRAGSLLAGQERLEAAAEAVDDVILRLRHEEEGGRISSVDPWGFGRVTLLFAVICGALLAMPWYWFGVDTGSRWAEPALAMGTAGAMGAIALAARVLHALHQVRAAHVRNPPGGPERHAAGVLLSLPVLAMAVPYGFEFVHSILDGVVTAGVLGVPRHTLQALLLLAMPAAWLAYMLLRARKGLAERRLRLGDPALEARLDAAVARIDARLQEAPPAAAPAGGTVADRPLTEEDLALVREQGPRVRSYQLAGDTARWTDLGIGSLSLGLIALLGLALLKWPLPAVLLLLLADWLGLLVADSMRLQMRPRAVLANFRMDWLSTQLGRVLDGLEGRGRIQLEKEPQEPDLDVRHLLTAIVFLATVPAMLLWIAGEAAGVSMRDMLSLAFLRDQLATTPLLLIESCVLAFALRVGKAWRDTRGGSPSDLPDARLAVDFGQLLGVPFGLALVFAMVFGVGASGPNAAMMVLVVVLAYRVIFGVGTLFMARIQAQQIEDFLAQDDAVHAARLAEALRSGYGRLPPPVR
jgi:hypothetical protein